MMRRRIVVLALIAVSISPACQSQAVKVLEGPINIHPCSVVNKQDAEKLLGGPVTEPEREYVRNDRGLELEDCSYESQRDSETHFDLSFDDEIRSKISDSPPEYGFRPVTGVGKAAVWLQAGPHAIEFDVLSSEGVLATYDVYIRGMSPAAILARTKALALTVLPRITKALPGEDLAELPTTPPVHPCGLVSREDQSAILGPQPLGPRSWESFGGRYGGGWLCAWWREHPDSYWNDAINVSLSREAPDVSRMRASQGPATTIPGLGRYAYWRSAETTPDNYGGTLWVLSNRGAHIRILVGLRDASREKPAALRLAQKILAQV